ncbi:leukotriene B4 receptor 1-like [Pungitius pungitius]|uniref:leukotriene B4 receptor 1-like n=1 Tax=Pungitius pungitius TaxID=134920 RepID=UPI002E14BFEC
MEFESLTDTRYQRVCRMEELNSSVVPSNISSSDKHPLFVAWVAIRLIPALVLSLCFLLGVPGNIAVIILRPNWQHMSSLSQSLMLNLAISDLLCLITLPLWIYMLLYSWTFGLVTCKLIAYVVYCSLYGSVLTVTALSVQRYLQVVKLQKIFSQVGRKRMLVLLWLTAMILSVPYSVFRQLSNEDHWTTCIPHYSTPDQQMAVLLTESLSGLVSIIVVGFSYISLHIKVNEAAFFNNPQTTRLVTSIIVTFFVLWMPYLITNMLMVAAISRNNEIWDSLMYSQSIVRALVFVNSFMNPLLYAFASGNMCTVCKKREHGYCC